jgi:hypothetical protein
LILSDKHRDNAVEVPIMKHAAFLFLSFAATCSAQTAPLHSIVSATGQASVYVAPDQVKVDATVITQGNSAQEAASTNATTVAAVVAALTKLLGQGANIKTIDYSVGPVYKYPSNGGLPTIAGYTASLTVETTLGDITMIGAAIDTAIQAGATSIGALQFSLKNPDPAHQQALALATKQASDHANAMAGALAHTVGGIISLQEGSPVSIQPIVVGVGSSPTTSTTVSPSLIQVQATVVLQAQLN